MRGVGLACLSLAVWSIAVSSIHAAPARRILVVGERGGDEAVVARGHRVVDAEPVERALEGLQERARRAEREAVVAITATLARAQDLYLEQEFDEMVEVLEELDREQRWLLSSPDHRELGWDVAFRLGLALLSRDDDRRAAAQFGLALSYRFEKRPASDLYGPDVAAAFGEAVAARERLAPRPVAIRTDPAGALIAVDGVAGLDNRRSLRSGLHVVRASAPGYLTAAVQVEIEPDTREVEIELSPDPGDGPVDAWTVASLAPGRAAFDELWRSMLERTGADAVLWVGKTRAVVVTARFVSSPASGASPRAAAAAALADWLGAPKIAAVRSRSLVREPLFWTGVAGAAALVAIGVVLLTSGDDGGVGGGITVGVVDP
jgi:hypothetical protein